MDFFAERDYAAYIMTSWVASPLPALFPYGIQNNPDVLFLNHDWSRSISQPYEDRTPLPRAGTTRTHRRRCD